MICKKYYEMTDKEKRETIRAEARRDHKTAQLELSEPLENLFVEDGYKLNGLNFELYFCIKRTKPVEMPDEIFDNAFQAKIALVDVTEMSEEKRKVFREVERDAEKIQTVMDFYYTRVFLISKREAHPAFGAAFDAMIFDIAQMLDHSRCRECDLCRFKEVEKLTDELDAHFKVDSRSLAKSVNYSTEDYKKLIYEISIYSQEIPQLRLYFVKLYDRIKKQVGHSCEKPDCLVCKFSFEKVFQMSLQGGRNARNN